MIELILGLAVVGAAAIALAVVLPDPLNHGGRATRAADRERALSALRRIGETADVPHTDVRIVRDYVLRHP